MPTLRTHSLALLVAAATTATATAAARAVTPSTADAAAPAVRTATHTPPDTTLPTPTVGVSPWGPDDDIGRLNLMTDASRSEVLARVAGGAAYDLSVDYFIGMPSWQAAGDPHYRMWMTHTPRGTVVDDPLGVGRAMNEHVSYSGAAVSMYTHMGTHIDALSHFGLDGRIWNGFRADEHLGDRGWQVGSAASIPPIVARGVLLDVARARGVPMLPPGYRITRQDLEKAMRGQGVDLRPGDVVLIRTGRMALFEDAAAFMADAPGLGMDAARFLADEAGAMVIGADNLSLEAFPSEVAGDYVPLHTFLLAQRGIPILELVFLEDLARDQVWEFAFLGGSLKLRGADAAPIRPVALPLESAARTAR
ncbi:MAG: cyclase family protein [Longimicrobiales bacterium]